MVEHLLKILVLPTIMQEQEEAMVATEETQTAHMLTIVEIG